MSDISTLQWLVEWANVGIVFALAASLIFGGASVFFSKRLNGVKDEKAARDKQASDEKIAAANAIAESARTETTRVESESKESVAKVEAESREKTAALEAEAEQAKKERAEADKQIAIANATAATASVRVEEEARLRLEAERSNAEAQLALEKYLDEVAERQKPRHLTAEQQMKLFEILRANPKGEVGVGCILGDGEGFAFATELDGLLKAAGWTVDGGGVSQGAFAPMNPIGVEVRVHSPPNVPARAIVLLEAFKAIGFPVFGVADKELPEQGVRIVVGNKP